MVKIVDGRFIHISYHLYVNNDSQKKKYETSSEIYWDYALNLKIYTTREH